MKQPFYIVALFSLVLFSCGESILDLEDQTYEPKIVIDGYIIPGHRVENIRISRNFPLNKQINFMEFPLIEAKVELTDLAANKVYPLTFNYGQFGFEYCGDDLKIVKGNSYKLSVSAEIDGQALSASSVTTCPSNGFKINRDKSLLGAMSYRETDSNGELKNFAINFDHAAGTTFYALSIVALEASPDNFIEDAPGHLEKKDLDDDLINFLKYEANWAQTSPDPEGNSTIKILWFQTWFYGKYRAILYAGDRNFRYYFLTHNDVQDIDGNLYEPKFFIEGDGIGVFGSAIADTVFFEILR